MLRKDVDEIFFMCLPLMWVFIGPGSLCLRDDQPMKRPPDNCLGRNQNFCVCARKQRSRYHKFCSQSRSIQRSVGSSPPKDSGVSEGGSPISAQL